MTPSPPQPAPPAALPQNAGEPVFAVEGRGTVRDLAAVLESVSGRKIRVHPAVENRTVSLRLDRATLKQALDEIAGQASAGWRRAPDGTIEILPLTEGGGERERAR